jgi:hypothetical protein
MDGGGGGDTGEELDAARTSLTALGGGGTTESMTRSSSNDKDKGTRGCSTSGTTSTNGQIRAGIRGSCWKPMRMQKRGPGHASACVFGICARVAEIA